MTPEPCGACVKAALTVSHEFHAGCPGCAARAVSRGPNFARCRKEGAQDRRYRAELEQFGVTHDQVREQAAKDMVT